MPQPKKYATHEEKLAARRMRSELQRRAAGIGSKVKLPDEELADRDRESKRKYRLENREKINTQTRERRAEKPGAYRLYVDNMTAERKEEHLLSKLAYRVKNRDSTRARAKKNYEDNAELAVWTNLKNRSRKLGIPFDLELQDLAAPEHCPVLGMKMGRGREHQLNGSSPSVDRLIPALGYVKGNIVIVSYRANRIKNDASPAELQAVAKFYNEIFTSRNVQ